MAWSGDRGILKPPSQNFRSLFGHFGPLVDKWKPPRFIVWGAFLCLTLAEGVGFEPTIQLPI